MIKIYLILQGIGLSAMWALMLSFLDQYIDITERIGSILIFSVGVISTSSPLIIGPFIQSHPMILIYFSSGCIAISVLTYILMLFLINKSLNIIHLRQKLDINSNRREIE